MRHPFDVLKPEYSQLLETMRVLRPLQVDIAARLLLKPENLSRYKEVAAKTGAPAALIAGIDYRESSANPRLALGQGDPWDRVSVHVPRGNGPWSSWIDAAVFYINFDHLNDQSESWSWPYVCWKGEAWNGFGYRAQGIHTPYLWGATNNYRSGLYVSDGQWDALKTDPRPGIIPLMRRMVALDVSLNFDEVPSFDHISATVSTSLPPVGVGGGIHDTSWVQHALNRCFLDAQNQLIVDNSSGRKTCAAVRAFQLSQHLTVDGLYGPETDAALTKLVEKANAAN